MRVFPHQNISTFTILVHIVKLSVFFRPLNILILNAGVFSAPFTLTDDSYESTFQTNHLSHFYMTQLLTPVLIKSAPARIVVVTSESHRQLKFSSKFSLILFVSCDVTLYLIGCRFSDLTFDSITSSQLSPSQQQYDWLLSYNRSKLCNILFSNELNRRLVKHRVFSNSCHPGNMISTAITRHWWLWKVIFTMFRPFSKSKVRIYCCAYHSILVVAFYRFLSFQEQGACCAVFCAAARELESIGGYYFNNCCRCEPTPLALDVRAAQKLWQLSEEMISNAKTLLLGVG